MAKHPAIRPVTPSQRIRLCVYGDPGVGKTTLAGSSGAKTLMIHPPVDHMDPIVGMNGVEEWQVTTWDDMHEALEYSRHDGEEWDWIWLDSISLFQDVGLDDIWEGVVQAKPSRAQFGLDRGEYGTNMWRLQEWIRHMIGCNMFNFGITAHPAWIDFDEDGETVTKLMPWIQGKSMPQKICGYMNVVGYMSYKTLGREGNKKKARVLSTEGSDRAYAKDQFNAFGGDIVNPSLKDMVELIDEKRSQAQVTKRPTRRRRRTK